MVARERITGALWHSENCTTIINNTCQHSVWWSLHPNYGSKGAHYHSVVTLRELYYYYQQYQSTLGVMVPAPKVWFQGSAWPGLCDTQRIMPLGLTLSLSQDRQNSIINNTCQQSVWWLLHPKYGSKGAHYQGFVTLWLTVIVTRQYYQQQLSTPNVTIPIPELCEQGSALPPFVNTIMRSS